MDERMERARKTSETLFGPRPAPAREPSPTETEISAAISGFAFGDVYSRPGLPIKTRCLITVGVLAALFRLEILRNHINAAMNVGATPEEVLEALLQTAAFAGVPCYGIGSGIAREVFKERGVLPE